MSPSVRNTLLALAALALVSVLAFLYSKTQAVDLRGPNEVTNLLRVLKEIDRRWDVDVLRANLETDTNALPPIDRSRAAEFRLTALRNATERTGSPTLNAGLPELTEAIRAKSKLVTRFENVHDQARQALAELTTHVREFPSQAVQLRVQSAQMSAALARLNVAAPIYFTLGTDYQFNVVYSSINELEAAVAGFPRVLRDKAALVKQAGRVLLDSKAEASKLARQIERLTSGPRLDNMALQFSQEIETLIQEKEIYRVYLITYTGALLVLIAWMGVKIKAAQLFLEHRVEERTRELSSALHQLKESETQLIQSEKMSSLGQMVAGVAHEINTPLAYVKNNLATVSEKLPELGGAIDEAERLLALLQSGAGANRDELNRQFAMVAQHIAQLKKNKVVDELAGLVNDGIYGTGQMAEIVDNLKDFSRLDRSRVTPFNLNEGLASTLLLAKHQLKTVTVEKHLGDIPDVVCSPTQINQVLLNLVTNAVQALEGGDGKIILRTREEASGVAVDVVDTGHGIPPEVLPKIFDPFFTTKDVGQGTGIGLSISYKIVQQHGGRIEVESIQGKGTRFTVYLPLEPSANTELGTRADS